MIRSFAKLAVVTVLGFGLATVAQNPPARAADDATPPKTAPAKSHKKKGKKHKSHHAAQNADTAATAAK